MTRLTANPVNKYKARRTWSELCRRWFSSGLECRRGEALRLLEMAGEISDLEYQPKWVLRDHNPRVTVKMDFRYRRTHWLGAETTAWVVEDAKGKDNEASRLRRAWLKEKYGIEVVLVKEA